MSELLVFGFVIVIISRLITMPKYGREFEPQEKISRMFFPSRSAHR